MSRNSPTKLSVTFICDSHTGNAMKVYDHFSEEEVWLPLSLVETIDRHPDSDTIEITIPEWLAESKGMI